MKAKMREGAAGLGGIAGQIDALRIAFDAGLIATPSRRLRILCTQQRWWRARGEIVSVVAATPAQTKTREKATTTATIMTTAKGKEQREKAKE